MLGSVSPLNIRQGTHLGAYECWMCVCVCFGFMGRLHHRRVLFLKIMVPRQNLFVGLRKYLTVKRRDDGPNSMLSPIC